MRINVTAAFLFLLAMCATAEATDGNWWRSASRDAKFVYLLGFTEGRLYHAQDMSVHIYPPLALAGTLPERCDKYCYTIIGQFLAKLTMNAEESFARQFRDVTVDQIVDGVNHVYADYRNRRIALRDAVRVVIESINGSPDETIAKRLAVMRERASRE